MQRDVGEAEAVEEGWHGEVVSIGGAVTDGSGQEQSVCVPALLIQYLN